MDVGGLEGDVGVDGEVSVSEVLKRRSTTSQKPDILLLRVGGARRSLAGRRIRLTGWLFVGASFSDTTRAGEHNYEW